MDRRALAAQLTEIERETRRSLRTIQVRETDEAVLEFYGYAAVFDVWYEVEDWMGTYEEKVAPGAFTKTLAERDDVRLLINHQGMPLARTRSATLQLSQDEIGLLAEAKLDATDPDVKALEPKLRRGDLDQMSHAFQAIRQEWNEDYTRRTLLEEKLFDVSVVTYPASPTTSAGIRAADLIRRLALADPEELLVAARGEGGPGLRTAAERVNTLLGRILDRGDPAVLDPPAPDDPNEADPPPDPEADPPPDPDPRDTSGTITIEAARRNLELIKLGAG